MEKLRSRILIVAVVMLAIGLFNTYSGVASATAPKTEAWMEEKSPELVDGMRFVRGNENPRQTYKMDKVTYEKLAPYGIVARHYTDDKRAFDVVLIASRSRASFHDPRVCFSGGGWVLNEESEETVTCQSRGQIKVTVARMDGPRKNQLAAYFYRGPSGFHASTLGLKFDMFLQRLMNRTDTDGVFYRFIPQSSECTKEDLLKFIGQYLDSAHASSGGYF